MSPETTVGPEHKTPRAALALGGAATLFALAFSLFLTWSGYATRTPDGAAGRTGFIGATASAILLLFVLWPALAALGILRGLVWLYGVGLALYVGQSVLFGFSFGGPHLVVGVPLLLGAGIAWRLGRRSRPVASHTQL
ncbi:MAG: hypothetical protein QOE90_2941 [Thermoplasmata archaeon]|nr:hypothetical protein [Thermoplasmata archaeon]